MYPDFTRDRLAYRLETPWGHLYEFELHHASHTQATTEAQREDLLLRGIATVVGVCQQQDLTAGLNCCRAGYQASYLGQAARWQRVCACSERQTCHGTLV
jgi:hypothetical protein